MGPTGRGEKKKRTSEWASIRGRFFPTRRSSEGSRLIRQRTGDTDICLDALEDHRRHHFASEPR